MLEDFTTAAVTERLLTGVLGEQVEGFCARLVELGYRPTTIRHKIGRASCRERVSDTV